MIPPAYAHAGTLLTLDLTPHLAEQYPALGLRRRLRFHNFHGDRVAESEIELRTSQQEETGQGERGGGTDERHQELAERAPLVGPGLGRGSHVASLVRELLARVNDLSARGARRLVIAVSGADGAADEVRVKGLLLRLYPRHLLGAVPLSRTVRRALHAG